MSSFIALMTSLCRTTESRAQPLCARVTSCLIAVRKPWGLKNPVIQNTLGRPLKIHVENWLFLSRNSVNQKPRVDDSQEIWQKTKRDSISHITDVQSASVYLVGTFESQYQKDFRLISTLSCWHCPTSLRVVARKEGCSGTRLVRQMIIYGMRTRLGKSYSYEIE